MKRILALVLLTAFTLSVQAKTKTVEPVVNLLAIKAIKTSEAKGDGS